MKYALLTAYELLTSVAPGFLSIIAVRAWVVRIGQRFESSRLAWATVMVIYLFVVYHLTGPGTVHDALQFSQMSSTHLNLIPIFGCYLLDFVLNVILFVPMGFLVPAIRSGRTSAAETLAAGAWLSVLIEASQMLNNRVTDINDLLANMVGAMIGYLVYNHLKTEDRIFASHDSGSPRYESLLYITASFIGRFLLFDEFGAASAFFGL